MDSLAMEIISTTTERVVLQRHSLSMLLRERQVTIQGQQPSA